MLVKVLVTFTVFAARTLAVSFQPLLTQISNGNGVCSSDELLGKFDLTSVPQFNALCNIPIPDIQQSEFLLENNVVPILCMGLLDVFQRLCKSAKNDLGRFEDIFPPTAMKFNNTLVELSNNKNFSSLDVFCSTTVKTFTIKEPSTNVSELWWQILNKELGDDKHCSDICHSNEENKVHPLCSFILWSNGVYLNYQKSQDVGLPTTSMDKPFNTEGDQKSSNAKNIEESELEAGKNQVGFIKNEPSIKPSDSVITSDLAPLLSEKSPPVEGTKSNLDNNIIGVGTVEQVIHNGVQSSDTNLEKTYMNPPTDKETVLKKFDKSKSEMFKEKQYKIKGTATTSTPIKSSNLGADSVIEKVVPSPSQAEVNVGPKTNSTAALPSVQGGAPNVPEAQKPGDGKPAVEGMVEGDFSLEVTPDNAALDQPLPADKDFQPPYSDEEGEDGDGDDVDIVESNNAQAITNTASNSSNPAASRASINGVASIQQGPLEGDKVYGEGEILIEDHFIEAEDSHFFTYFLCMAVLTIMAYLAFHNKKKLIALAVEGRRTKGGRRRPNSSHYSKLDCSLEEALVSNTTASVTHVLY